MQGFQLFNNPEHCIHGERLSSYPVISLVLSGGDLHPILRIDVRPYFQPY